MKNKKRNLEKIIFSNLAFQNGVNDYFQKNKSLAFDFKISTPPPVRAMVCQKHGLTLAAWKRHRGL